MNIQKINRSFILHKTSCASSVSVCIRSLMDYFGITVPVDDIWDKQKGENTEATLLDFLFIFRSVGLNADGYKADSISNIEELSNPSIIPIYTADNRNGFAIYYGKYENKYLIADPTWGLNLYDHIEFESIWRDRIFLEVYSQ